jgi:hypothetical protein
MNALDRALPQERRGPGLAQGDDVGKDDIEVDRAGKPDGFLQARLGRARLPARRFPVRVDHQATLAAVVRICRKRIVV